MTRYLLKQLVNSTIEDVSLGENVGYDAVVGALNRQIDTQVDWQQIDDLSTLALTSRHEQRSQELRRHHHDPPERR